MNVLIIDNGTHNLELIKSFFPNDSITTVSCNEVQIEHAVNSNLIILSGSASSSGTKPVIYSAEDLKNEREIIKSIDKPIVGICYGCELIAHVYGCKIEITSPKIVNFVDIETPGEILGFHKKSFKVFDSHKYLITELSGEIDGLAKSKHGYEIIKHKTKPIYGTQFHPEKFQDVTEGDDIFRKILELTKNA